MSESTLLKCSTHWARIYSSGPIETAKSVIREFCLASGLCVTVDPTTFLYTGGEEAGFVVGLLNYPRFESTPGTIDATALALAYKLLGACGQHSILLTSPRGTQWITRREQG